MRRSVAGTFFLMQHLEDDIDDVDERSRIARQLNSIVEKARVELGFAGVPVFQYEKSAEGHIVKLVTNQGLLDIELV